MKPVVGEGEPPPKSKSRHPVRERIGREVGSLRDKLLQHNADGRRGSRVSTTAVDGSSDADADDFLVGCPAYFVAEESPDDFDYQKSEKQRAAVAKWKRCECCRINTHGNCVSLMLLVFFLVASSSFLVFAHYCTGAYEPVFVGGSMHAFGLGMGLLGSGLLRENYYLLSSAFVVLLCACFPLGYTLTYAGTPPFDAHYALGTGGWEGRNVTALGNGSWGISLLTFRYATWIISEITCLSALVYLLYIGCCVLNYNTELPVFAGNYPEKLLKDGFLDKNQKNTTPELFTSRKTCEPIVCWSYARALFAALYVVGLLVDWGLAINDIKSRNAYGSAYTYTWARYDSPFFILSLGVGLVAHRIARQSTVKEETANLYGRWEYYWACTLLLFWGAFLACFFFVYEYAGRLIPASNNYYKAQVMNATGIDISKRNGYANCFADTTCYTYINPVVDGDYTYYIKRTPIAAPQMMPMNTLNEDIIHLWLLVTGLVVAIAQMAETTIMSVFHMRGVANVWSGEHNSFCFGQQGYRKFSSVASVKKRVGEKE